ncbi:MAG: hypothetical protein HY927_05530 [Elusimicrobia bacterium]|nr:hypothetical protein [Elusimicrobiota bacterium]
MGWGQRFAVLLILTLGAFLSYSHRQKRSLLIATARARFPHYAGSKDAVNVDCVVTRMTTEEKRAYGSRFPGLPTVGSFDPLLGTCRVKFDIRDHPQQGSTAHFAAELRYVWGVGRRKVWHPLEFRLLD